MGLPARVVEFARSARDPQFASEGTETVWVSSVCILPHMGSSQGVFSIRRCHDERPVVAAKRRHGRIETLLDLNELPSFDVSPMPGASGRSYIVPLLPGEALPAIPAGGFDSEAEAAGLPGARRT